MMKPIVVSAVASGSYGALELKHGYRKSMMLSVILAATAHMAIVGGILIWQASDPIPIGTGLPVIIIDDPSDLVPPPSMVFEEPSFSVTDAAVVPPVGYIPNPMPDEDVFEEVHIATTSELAFLSVQRAAGTRIGDNARVIVNTPPVDIFPKSDEFVAYQEEPVTIHFETPDYPEMAELTGQAGIVWIRALVDKEGRVHDAHVQKPSGANVGFEEAALSAAFKNVYRPAIQNGQPVAVWISYKVEFRLR